jgi:hypothetical protein
MTESERTMSWGRRIIAASLSWGRSFAAAWRGEPADPLPWILRTLVACLSIGVLVLWCYAEYVNAGRL